MIAPTSDKRAGPIEILRNFPGGSLGPWNLDGNVLEAHVRQEPIVEVDWTSHDYSLHFLFGTRNRGDAEASLRIRVRTPQPVVAGVRSHGRVFLSDTFAEEFEVAPMPAVTDGSSSFEWESVLAPGQVVYWSNTLWRPLPIVTGRAHDLASVAGLSKATFGRSVDGRELVLYAPVAPAGSTPTLLITSGLHPMEGDTVGTEAILRWLGNQGASVARRWNVVVVPVANPDGFVRGNNGCNASGVNFFWDFRFKDSTRCPEAYYLWKLIERVRPLVLIDFHSYSVQGLRKKPGAYFQPAGLYSGMPARRLAESLERELNGIPGTQPQKLIAPSSMPVRIARALNTVTVAKYHLHQDLGRAGMESLAIEVVRRTVAVLERLQVAPEQIHVAPYGKVRRTVGERLRRAMRLVRYVAPRLLRRRLRP